MDTVLCVLLCCLVPRLGISQYLGRERESEFNRDQKNETKANDKETSKKKKKRKTGNSSVIECSVFTFSPICLV